jgi:cytochrome P450
VLKDTATFTIRKEDGTNRHIAFGAAIHFCLGHQLARIEDRCALQSLFRRWPKLTLAVGESEIVWRKRPGLKAIERLPGA